MVTPLLYPENTELTSDQKLELALEYIQQLELQIIQLRSEIDRSRSEIDWKRYHQLGLF